MSDTGTLIRDERGRILPGTAPGPGVIRTREQSDNLRRKRAEKTARLLRESITLETADKLVMSGKPTPAAAVAAAGGILWREVVLDSSAYPRDRLEAWTRIGQTAEVLADPRIQAQAQLPAMPADVDIVAIVLRRRLMSNDLLQDAIDAQAQDVTSEEV